MAERLLTDATLRERMVAEASEHVLSFDWADVARQVAGCTPRRWRPRPGCDRRPGRHRAEVRRRAGLPRGPRARRAARVQRGRAGPRRHGDLGDRRQHVATRGRGSARARRRIQEAGRVGIIVRASDSGPGIADTDEALADGWSSVGSMGMGLPGARRLMDEFEMASGPGRGTTVTMTRWHARRRRRVGPAGLERRAGRGAVRRARAGVPLSAAACWRRRSPAARATARRMRWPPCWRLTPASRRSRWPSAAGPSFRAAAPCRCAWRR